MSKKALGLLLVAALVFAFASAAFADWGNSGYITVNDIVADSSGSTNPHGPYDTSSRKCAVCHAVHGADAGGAQLLRSGAADPCVTCHISTAAGNIYVYNGNENAYSTTTNNEFAHDTDGSTGIECKGCHTVHGAGTVVGGVTGQNGTTYNLKAFAAYSDTMPYARASRPAATYSAYSVATTGTGPYSLSKWCSGCHPYYNTSYNGRTHVMTTMTATYDNPSSTVNVQVAWVNSNACDDCHSSKQHGDNDGSWPSSSTQGVAFPHYTAGARFLESATSTSNPTGTATPAGKAGYDAVCLKCHINGTGQGVGLTF